MNSYFTVPITKINEWRTLTEIYKNTRKKNNYFEKSIDILKFKIK
jgi:hypothetical protein